MKMVIKMVKNHNDETKSLKSASFSDSNLLLKTMRPRHKSFVCSSEKLRLKQQRSHQSSVEAQMHCGRLIKKHTDLHMTLYRVTRSWLESGHITARPATVCFSFNGKRSGRTCSVSSCSPQTSGENWHGFIFMWLTEELHKLLDFVSKHVCQMWYFYNSQTELSFNALHILSI